MTLIAILAETAFPTTPAIADNKAASASKGVAYVTNQDGGAMDIDLNTMEVKWSIDIEAKIPRGIGVTADGKWLITANKNDANSIIDTSAVSMPRHVSIVKNPEFVRVMGDITYVTYEPSSKSAPVQPKLQGN